ncbi:MAG: hypothetical protein ABR898_08700 [Terracidiphilus sp.]|jgi:hypothetical protein
MTIEPSTAASVLTDLVREDRNEARIWRTRLENLTSSVLLASFGISAFFLGKAAQPSAVQLRAITLLVDCCLMAVTSIFFFRVKRDLVALRKGQRYRQDMLICAVKGLIEGFDPFNYPAGTKPAITDTDLIWLFALSLGLILVKMLAVSLCPAVFLTLAQAH